MSRPIVILLIVLVVLVGAMVWLAGRDGSQPQTRVEKVVPLENLSR